MSDNVTVQEIVNTVNIQQTLNQVTVNSAGIQGAPR
jgi:hypothetical protein